MMTPLIIIRKISDWLRITKPVPVIKEAGFPSGLPVSLPFEPSLIYGNIRYNGKRLEYGDDYYFGATNVTFKFITFSHDVIIYEDLRGNRYKIQISKRTL